MLKLVLVSCFVALTAVNGHKGGHRRGFKVPHGGVILPWRPFPHFEDLALFKVGDQTFLPGSAFVQVNGTECNRVQFTDEMGGYCPLNQTVCDQIVANVCTPQQANATCFEAPTLGATSPPGQPTAVPEGRFGNGHPYGGPLCHVEINGQKFQPSAYTAIFTLSPKVQTCVFDVAPAPTVFPAPTGPPPPRARDPFCPYIER